MLSSLRRLEGTVAGGVDSQLQQQLQDDDLPGPSTSYAAPTRPAGSPGRLGEHASSAADQQSIREEDDLASVGPTKRRRIDVGEGRLSFFNPHLLPPPLLVLNHRAYGLGEGVMKVSFLSL